MSRSSPIFWGSAAFALLVAGGGAMALEPPYPPSVERAVEVSIAANDSYALAAVVGANPRFAGQIVVIAVTAHPDKAAEIAELAAAALPQIAPQIAAAAAIANPKAAAAIAGAVTTTVPRAGKATGEAILAILPDADRTAASTAIKAAVKDAAPMSLDDSALRH
jgi:hypothetical protein